MLVNPNKESRQVNPGDFLIIDTPGGGDGENQLKIQMKLAIIREKY